MYEHDNISVFLRCIIWLLFPYISTIVVLLLHVFKEGLFTIFMMVFFNDLEKLILTVMETFYGFESKAWLILFLFFRMVINK